MPNWVFNKVTLSTSNASFLEHVENFLGNDKEVLSFENVLPRSSSASDTLQWNIENWGTKWDASDVTLHKVNSTCLVYFFNTPWSPPLPVFVSLSTKYQSLDVCLEFEEEQGFGAILNINNGVINVVKEWDIPNSHADLTALGKVCDCTDDEQVYLDCFSARAILINPDDLHFIEAVTVLAKSWTGNFKELLAASAKL